MVSFSVPRLLFRFTTSACGTARTFAPATDTAARDLPACAMEMVVHAAFYTLASAAPPASDMDDCNDADSLSFS